MRHHVLKPFDTVSNMVEVIPLGPSELSPWKCVGAGFKASMQPAFVNIPCVFEKNVYSAVVKQGDVERSAYVKTVVLTVFKQTVVRGWRCSTVGRSPD